MQGFKRFLLHEHSLVFMFCLAAILGPAISILFAYDLTQFPDCKSYLGLAHLDFDQSPVRRYRVIIPFAAGALNYVFGGIFSKLSPTYFVGDFGLPFSFFLVNASLMALFGLLIYRYCRAFGVNALSAVIGVAAMMTCRYTTYTAALPLVDSLFCVIVALTLLGIKTKHTGMLLWAIFLGPFAKEAFIFIAPLIFFFSHIDKRRQLVCFALSGIFVFTFRFVYDLYAPKPIVGGLAADLYHIPNLIRYLPSLFSFYGLYKVLMNIGLWLLVPVLLFWVSPNDGRSVFSRLDRYLIWFMLSVLVQMLLSGSLERMFYLAMPVICAVVALSARELTKLYLPAEK